MNQYQYSYSLKLNTKVKVWVLMWSCIFCLCGEAVCHARRKQSSAVNSGAAKSVLLLLQFTAVQWLPVLGLLLHTADTTLFFRLKTD